jgi:hypothetical protein
VVGYRAPKAAPRPSPLYRNADRRYDGTEIPDTARETRAWSARGSSSPRSPAPPSLSRSRRHPRPRRRCPAGRVDRALPAPAPARTGAVRQPAGCSAKRAATRPPSGMLLLDRRTTDRRRECRCEELRSQGRHGLIYWRDGTCARRDRRDHCAGTLPPCGSRRSTASCAETVLITASPSSSCADPRRPKRGDKLIWRSLAGRQLSIERLRCAESRMITSGKS